MHQLVLLLQDKYMIMVDVLPLERLRPHYWPSVCVCVCVFMPCIDF